MATAFRPRGDNHPGRGLVTGAYLGARIAHPPQYDAADEIPASRAPLLPPAALAFPPEELAARLALYASRAALGLPVCTGAGEAEPVREDVATCWACGRRCPKGNHTGLAGWHSRPAFGPACKIPEVYCPRCFREWGWIDPPGVG